MSSTLLNKTQQQAVLHAKSPCRLRRSHVCNTRATAIPSAIPVTAWAAPAGVQLQAPPLPGALPPAKTYEAAVQLGVAKANAPATKIFVSGIVAGAFIAFGAWLLMAVGGACPGVAAANPGLQKIIAGSWGLPFGLSMVILSGSELFTGNTALLTMAALERKASLPQLLKSWSVSYLGNFVGSLVLVALVHCAGSMAASPAPAAMALAKTSMPFTQAFCRGILCNWLVCMAVWQATAATTVSGKILGIYMPIAAFVALGLEHSVANMFIVPLGIMNGAAVSFGHFLTSNLVPVTLGNIVGGALCVATVYAFTLGGLGEPKQQ